MKGEFIMPTKLLEREAILAGNSLRNLSQKSLLEMVSTHDKLGVIVNKNLSIAMLSWERYESIVDWLQELQEIIEQYESLMEDMELAKIHGEELEKIERGEAETFTVDSVSEVFNMLKK